MSAQLPVVSCDQDGSPPWAGDSQWGWMRAKAPPREGGASKGASSRVSRILSWTAIYLGPALLQASRGLPGT